MSNPAKARIRKRKKNVRKKARIKEETRTGKPSQKKPLKKAKQPMTTNKHNTQESPPENLPKDTDQAESPNDSATVTPVSKAETQGEDTSTVKQLDTIRGLDNLKDFDAYIKELSASQANVTKMMGVLLPGHGSTRDLVQAIWEGLYSHYQEEDWKLSDFSSFSSTMQRLTSMQNQFDALEMRRLEFARDHKALTQFSHKAMEAIREHADTLSPEALVKIESAINFL